MPRLASTYNSVGERILQDDYVLLSSGEWGEISNIKSSVFEPALDIQGGDTDGKEGLVPKPLIDDIGNFLSNEGWVDPLKTIPIFTGAYETNKVYGHRLEEGTPGLVPRPSALDRHKVLSNEGWVDLMDENGKIISALTNANPEHPNAGGRTLNENMEWVDIPNKEAIDEMKINAGTVNGKEVLSDVPADAKFTDNDTTYTVKDGELSEKSFTTELQTKLSKIESGATADQTKADIDKLKINASTVDGKTVGVSVPSNAKFTDENTTYSIKDGELSKNNFTDELQTKLSKIEDNANFYKLPADVVHDDNYVSTANDFTNILSNKLNNVAENANLYVLPDDVVIDANYVSTEKSFTAEEKKKLAGLDSSLFLGEHLTLDALIASNPTPKAGSHAYVDEGIEKNVVKYIWDTTDNTWFLQSGKVAAETAATVKNKYETNADTNVFDDAAKQKLKDIEAGAQKNEPQAALLGTTAITNSDVAKTSVYSAQYINAELNEKADANELVQFGYDVQTAEEKADACTVLAKEISNKQDTNATNIALKADKTTVTALETKVDNLKDENTTYEVATAESTGLLSKLNSDDTFFMDGTGNWSKPQKLYSADGTRKILADNAMVWIDHEGSRIEMKSGYTAIMSPNKENEVLVDDIGVSISGYVTIAGKKYVHTDMNYTVADHKKLFDINMDTKADATVVTALDTKVNNLVKTDNNYSTADKDKLKDIDLAKYALGTHTHSDYATTTALKTLAETVGDKTGDSAENGVAYVMNPEGGTYYNYSAKGIIQIKLPIAVGSLAFAVDIYSYVGIKSATIYITGRFTAHDIKFPQATIVGSIDADHQVSFSHEDEAHNYIQIGTSNTTWHELHVKVRDVSISGQHSTVDRWNKDWSVSLVNVFTGTHVATSTGSLTGADWNKLKNKPDLTALNYAATGHSHSDYAATGHSHTNYALTTHSHSNYATTGHSHSNYATTTHTHNNYAATGHTHDYSSEFASSSHTHDNYALTGGSTSEAFNCKVSSLASNAVNNKRMETYVTGLGYKTTDTNTWRGITSLLDDVSQDTSLSAAAGRNLQLQIDKLPTVNTNTWRGVTSSLDDVSQDTSLSAAAGRDLQLQIDKLPTTDTNTWRPLMTKEQIEKMGFSTTDTNTWRGVTDSLGDSSSNTSLSAKAGKNLQNQINALPKNTNTWRGVTNSLSDSDSDTSLSASAGKDLQLQIETVNNKFRTMVEVVDKLPTKDTNTHRSITSSLNSSDSGTSLSAAAGKVLNDALASKSASDHGHDYSGKYALKTHDHSEYAASGHSHNGYASKAGAASDFECSYATHLNYAVNNNRMLSYTKQFTQAEKDKLSKLSSSGFKIDGTNTFLTNNGDKIHFPPSSPALVKSVAFDTGSGVNNWTSLIQCVQFRLRGETTFRSFPGTETHSAAWQDYAPGVGFNMNIFNDEGINSTADWYGNQTSWVPGKAKARALIVFDTPQDIVGIRYHTNNSTNYALKNATVYTSDDILPLTYESTATEGALSTTKITLGAVAKQLLDFELTPLSSASSVLMKKVSNKEYLLADGTTVARPAEARPKGTTKKIVLDDWSLIDNNFVATDSKTTFTDANIALNRGGGVTNGIFLSTNYSAFRGPNDTQEIKLTPTDIAIKGKTTITGAVDIVGSVKISGSYPGAPMFGEYKMFALEITNGTNGWYKCDGSLMTDNMWALVVKNDKRFGNGYQWTNAFGAKNMPDATGRVLADAGTAKGMAQDADRYQDFDVGDKYGYNRYKIADYQLPKHEHYYEDSYLYKMEAESAGTSTKTAFPGRAGSGTINNYYNGSDSLRLSTATEHRKSSENNTTHHDILISQPTLAAGYTYIYLGT